MYDWKQICLHLAFLFLYLCDAFHIYFLFCKTATKYVRIWSRILSVVGQRGVSEGDEQCHPTFTRLVFLSDALQRLSFLGRIYIFHSIICFIIFLMTWTWIHVFFVSWYSWMFPNSFILVLLDFVWYCYHQLSAISFSFLIWSLYVTFERYVSCWC